MEKAALRDELMHQLWRMNKMDLMVSLREFLEGETATLNYLFTNAEERVTPTALAEAIGVSRARMANILRSLRTKEYITMEIAESDRRKMYVRITAEGLSFCREKYDYLVRYFDLYTDVLGEADIKELIRLIKKTLDSEALLKK